MLRPTKHTNPRLSVLNGAATMLNELQQKRIVSYDAMTARLRKSLGPEFEPDFFAYASFLFLIGKVKYTEKTDSFMYIDGVQHENK